MIDIPQITISQFCNRLNSSISMSAVCFSLLPVLGLFAPTNTLFSQFTDVSGTSPELHVSRVELVAKIPDPLLKSEECVGRAKQSLDL